jgi:hypothetical protein
MHDLASLGTVCDPFAASKMIMERQDRNTKSVHKALGRYEERVCQSLIAGEHSVLLHLCLLIVKEHDLAPPSWLHEAAFRFGQLQIGGRRKKKRKGCLADPSTEAELLLCAVQTYLIYDAVIRLRKQRRLKYKGGAYEFVAAFLHLSAGAVKLHRRKTKQISLWNDDQHQPDQEDLFVFKAPIQQLLKEFPISR